MDGLKKYFIYGLVLILAFGVRVWKLDKIPPHLSNDEISIAFDTVSVAELGKDEHGNFLPLAFESHSTYKSPLYAYLSMPLVKIVGENEYGIRMLSAISGTVLVLVLMMVGKMWAGKNLGLIVGVLAALNPWNIYASRMAYEANLGVTMFALGWWQAMRFWEERKTRQLFWAGIFLGLAVWAYHTFWLLSPLLAGVIIWQGRKIALKNWVILLVSMSVVALPILVNFLGNVGSSYRASTEGWWHDNYLASYMSKSSDGEIKKKLVWLTTPLINYGQYLGLETSFARGLDLFEGREILDSGWFLWPVLIMVVIGMIKGKEVLGRGRFYRLLGLFLLVPIVPALTKGEVAQVRNLAMTVPVLLLAGVGMGYIWEKRRRLAYVLFSLWLVALGVFGLAYFVHFPIQAGDRFQYGYKQAAEWVVKNSDDYPTVVVEDRFGPNGEYSGVPHLYFGYFGAFEVDQMQERKSDKELGLMIGKFQFRKIDWNREKENGRSLYVVSRANRPTSGWEEKLNFLETIWLPNRQEQFLIYETID